MFLSKPCFKKKEKKLTQLDTGSVSLLNTTKMLWISLIVKLISIKIACLIPV